MAGRTEHLEHLAKQPLFSACSKRELQRIARAFDELEVPAGRVLVDQGQAGREAFIVLDGTATVSRNNRKVATLSSGEQFGELALLDHGPRTATVTAETPMRLLVASSRSFAGVIDDVPSIARKLLAELAGRIRELDRKIYG
ncbi:MAG TPA: cyclic nucleotide-binding domain-containing protein [Acidimicrobiales bacterium]|jgi:CRP-like cAMP-binding protein|nr:cyclic nucleotide-binding domain-containing protein [Acidimicrobiales bacterium]